MILGVSYICREFGDNSFYKHRTHLLSGSQQASKLFDVSDENLGLLFQDISHHHYPHIVLSDGFGEPLNILPLFRSLSLVHCGQSACPLGGCKGLHEVYIGEHRDGV